MTSQEIRRKALLAAGSVVLAAGLAGCPIGGVDTGSGGKSTTDTAAEAAAETAAETASAPPTCAHLESDPHALTECCEALRAWCEDEVGPDETAVNDCVYGPEFDGSTGCIPWGPPVPPKSRLA